MTPTFFALRNITMESTASRGGQGDDLGRPQAAADTTCGPEQSTMPLESNRMRRVSHLKGSDGSGAMVCGGQPPTGSSSPLVFRETLWSQVHFSGLLHREVARERAWCVWGRWERQKKSSSRGSNPGPLAFFGLRLVSQRGK